MTGRFSEKSFDSRPMNTKVVTKKRRVERQTSESCSIRLLRVVHERRREPELVVQEMGGGSGWVFQRPSQI